ncbi:MAG: hypothetical protein AAGA15_14480 [Pseudomonadota bacterium]
MYDAPHVQAANDALWAEIRRALPFEAPARLTRSENLMEDWRAPDLLLSQTCGLIFTRHLSEVVCYVATPDHGVPGCPPGHYFSALVHRIGEDPSQGARLAYNDADSQSGWGAAQGYGFLPTLQTGAHALSLAAVADGHADVALIDRHTLFLVGLPDGLTVRETTTPTPAPPLITSRAEWIAPLRAALTSAMDTIDEVHRAALNLTGFPVLNEAQYFDVPEPPAL